MSNGNLVTRLCLFWLLASILSLGALILGKSDLFFYLYQPTPWYHVRVTLYFLMWSGVLIFVFLILLHGSEIRPHMPLLVSALFSVIVLLIPAFDDVRMDGVRDIATAHAVAWLMWLIVRMCQHAYELYTRPAPSERSSLYPRKW
jgi:hypothetical protein